MKLTNKVQQVKPEKSYGHLTINSKDFAFAKDLKIGSETELEIKVKIKGLRAPDNWDISENGMKPGDIIAEVMVKNISHKPEMKEEKEEK